MDKEERSKFEKEVEQAVYASMSDPKYWTPRRHRWDEWGSPVGLAICGSLSLISVGVFLYLLHLAGLL